MIQDRRQDEPRPPHRVQPRPYTAAVPWRPPTLLSTLRAPRPAVQQKQPAPPALTSATAPPPWPRAAMRAALLLLMVNVFMVLHNKNLQWRNFKQKILPQNTTEQDEI